MLKKKQALKSPSKSKKPQVDGISYHHGDLRNLVLKVSGEFLEEKGVHNLSLRDVASAIGVSHTAPYRHFPRKIDLLYALTTQGFLELRDTLLRAWEESEDSFLKLKKAGENYIRLMWMHPRRTELMFSGEIYMDGPVPEELNVAGKEAYFALYHIVEYGQNKGDFKTDADAENISMAVWSAVHGFAVLNEKFLKQAKSKEDKAKIEDQMAILLKMIEIGIQT
jgi:AcrR family transcriptional regulator